MLETLAKNSFVGAFASGLLIALITWCAKLWGKHQKSKCIFKILEDGLMELNKEFLPTAYLSSKSGYTQADVESLCSYHPDIRRNEKDLETWRITKK